MQLGVVFPQTEIGADPGAVRAFATAAEELGYDYILAFDHVIGVERASRPGFTGPYDHTHAFHEPFVLFAYLAGLTRRIGFMTGIVILPQRQTVLVAKQAAALDVLSSGQSVVLFSAQGPDDPAIPGTHGVDRQQVVFVLNIADQFLDDIFQSDHTGDSSVGVPDERDMCMFLHQLFEHAGNRRGWFA